MVCQNWAMISIRDIAMLYEWEKNMDDADIDVDGHDALNLGGRRERS